jgi:hypothetical protein
MRIVTGVGGLLRDKTRKPGKPRTADAVVQRVVALTCGEPPGEATHWTGRAMAAAMNLSLRAKCRPDLKVRASPMVATSAVATIGPTPGTLIRRCTVSSRRA